MFQTNIPCSFHTLTNDFYDVSPDSVHHVYSDGIESTALYNIYYTTKDFENYFARLRNQSEYYSIKDRPGSDTDVLVSFYSEEKRLIGTSDLSKYMAVGYIPIEIIVEPDGTSSKHSDKFSYGSEITILINA
ncbi:MAG: hypothetical protein K1X91_10210 [Bacteriodetes bacterium]|nr:hypothetical protein [Bacteroidota bacterium]